MSSPRITYTAHPAAKSEGEVAALANVYRFLIDRAMKNATGMTKTSGTSVRHTEGVGDVERQPN
jgi:hypothetical protein